MTKLENCINTVLQQLKTELADATWESRRQCFSQMLKLAKALNINEPCPKLYEAFVADEKVSVGRRSLRVRCVKLLDVTAGTKAKNERGILFNEQALPSKTEAQEYFCDKHYPLDSKISIDYLIVKAEIEMQHLNLSDSTIGQYRHSWIGIRRYFIQNDTVNYDECLLQRFIKNISLQRNNGVMREWKWKINRKAAHVLKEVVNTGCFKWRMVNRSVSCAGMETESIRSQYLSSLSQRNLGGATISLYDYVFRKTMEFAGIETRDGLLSLSPDKIQLVINKFALVCNKRSLATILPILRSLLKFFHAMGLTQTDLSGVVMGCFIQRGSVAAYISEKEQAELIAQLDNEPKRTKAVVLLAMKLGLRDCDICNLTFQEIDWRNDKIRLNQNKTGEPLVLPLLPDVGNALMDYILNERAKRNDCYPYVFLRKQAPYNKLSSVYPICSKLLRHQQIEPVNGTTRGVHIFRYTLVHRLLSAKVPHQVITNVLGHVSKESDKPYLSMDESMLRMCALDLSVIGKVSWKGDALND